MSGFGLHLDESMHVGCILKSPKYPTHRVHRVPMGAMVKTPCNGSCTYYIGHIQGSMKLGWHEMATHIRNRDHGFSIDTFYWSTWTPRVLSAPRYGPGQTEVLQSSLPEFSLQGPKLQWGLNSLEVGPGLVSSTLIKLYQRIWGGADAPARGLREGLFILPTCTNSGALDCPKQAVFMYFRPQRIGSIMFIFGALGQGYREKQPSVGVQLQERGCRRQQPEDIPDGPSSQYVRLLAPKTRTGTVFGTRSLGYLHPLGLIPRTSRWE